MGPLRNEREDNLNPGNTIPPGNRNQRIDELWSELPPQGNAVAQCWCESAIIARKPDFTDCRAFFNCRPRIELG